jgi:hypothetical protein
MFYVRSVTASSCFIESFLFSDATFMLAFASGGARINKPRATDWLRGRDMRILRSAHGVLPRAPGLLPGGSPQGMPQRDLLCTISHSNKEGRGC